MHKNKSGIFNKRITSAAFALSIIQSPAYSQISDNRGGEDFNLEEIVVTARKREENLLDVPLSITAFSADDISNRNLQSVTDLSRLTPNFTYVDIGQRYIDAPIVRGITSDLLDNTRQAASFFIDGVYITGSASTFAFSDIERVEVLRGPQSTLFGRSTFAGAVNYVTKRPTNELQGTLSVSGAEDEDYEVIASISGPLGSGDMAKFRLAGRYFSYGGEWKNTLFNPGEELGGQQSKSVAGALYLIPTDALEITAKLSLSEDDDDHSATLLRGQADHNCGPSFGGAGIPAVDYICGEIGFDESLLGLSTDEIAGVGPGLKRDLLRSSVAIEWSNDKILITSISGYNDETSDRAFDIDFEPEKLFVVGGIDTAQVNNFRNYEDFSQELRLQSIDEAPMQWLIGAYYLDFEQETGRDFPAPSAFEPERLREEELMAVFGSLEYSFTNGLSLTFEGRYQEAEITISDLDTGELLVIDDQGGLSSETFTKFLPRLTANYAVTDDLNVYAYWAEGNRPGGFNTNPGLPRELAIFDEEEIETYEIGAKFSLLDNRIAGEVAIFFNDIKNLTTRSTFLPAGSSTPLSLLEDAGSQESTGFELSLNTQVNKRLNIAFNLGYTDAELKEGVTISSSRLLGTTDPTAVSGLSPAQVPEWTGALIGRYEFPIDIQDFSAYIDGDVSYRSSLYGDEANLAETGDSTRVNLRLGIENGRYQVEGFARNLFDDDTPIRVSTLTQFSTFQQGVQITPSRSRQLGIRVSMDF